MPSYEITGTYNGSQIERGLQNLESQIQKVASSMSRIKAPTITPTANFGSFFSEMDKAESYAAKGSIGKMFDGVDFGKAGKRAGADFAQSFAYGFGPAGSSMAGLATSLGAVGIAGLGAAAGVAAIGAASVNAARQWESLMAGVSKTTGLQGAELQNLSSTLLDLSTKIPVAQADIAKIAATGGTLGVSQANLPKFVTDVSMASVGWQMDAESTAQSIAGISNAYKVPISDAQKFGSVINTMADSVGGSEKELADFLVRASGIATTFNEGIAATTAFGAVLASINMPMEVAATGLQSMMAYSQADPKRMTAWADMMGISVGQLKTKLETDLYGTIIESSNAIKTVGGEADQQAKRIALWGEGGARISAGLVGMGDKYAGALKLANEEMKTGSSLMQAFGAQGATLDSAMTRLGNSVNKAAIQLGNTLLPAVTALVNWMADATINATKMGEAVYGGLSKAGSYVEEKAKATGSFLNQFGYNEMPELEARKREEAAKAAGRVTNTSDWTTVDEAPALIAGSKAGATYSNALKDALGSGIPKAVSNAYLGPGLASAAASSGKLSGKEWTTAFEAALKANISPQIAALTTSGVSEEDAIAIITGQTRGRKSKSTTSYDVLGTSMSVTRESADTGYFESFYMNGKIVGEEVFNLYNKLGKESSYDIGNAYYKSFKGSIRDSGAFMEDHYTRISKSVGEVVADGVFAPVEKKQLEAYKSILETFQKEMPLSFSADDSKLLANIDSIIQGKTFKLDVEAMVKPVYEDWKSAAYQEKFFYENKDVTKQLTREQATALAGTKADFATIIENKDNKYSPQQVNLAKEGNQAIDNVFTAVQDGTGSTAGLMGTSISVLQKIDSSILNQGTWLSQLVAAYNKSSAQSFATGSMKGQYYSWYGGQSAYSTSTGGYQSSAPLATADTASWIDKLYYKVPHLATGGKTTKAGLAYIGEETEYIIPESKLNPAEGKFYSGMWAQDEIDSRLRITPPVSAFQSSAKSGTVPIMTTGSPILNPWTDSPILNPNYMLQMQAAWSGNSLVKPSAGVSNPKVVDYAGQLAEAQRNAAITTDKYANVQDANLKAVLQQSDMLLLKTAADGKYCEAVSDFAIAQEEAKGLFYDSYIGPSGAYSKAKSLGALSMRDNQPEYISKRLEEIKDDTKDIKESTKKTASGLENLKTGSSANPIMTYDGLGGSKAIQITQAMIDAARANEDEYAQITMGLQPFTYGLAQFSAENGKFCQAISDFGLAQEYSGNFMASYVGVSNDAYAQMKAAEAQYGPNSEAVKALGQTLGIVPAEGWGPNQVSTTEQTDASTQLLQRTGIGFGSLANLGDRTLSATREMAKSSAKTEINTEKISTNTANFPSFMSGMGSFFGTMTYGSGGGGSGALNSRGGFGGSMGSFYGSSWYGGGAAGLSAAFGSAPASSWMNAAATSIGGSGAIQWAKGGLVASPTFFQDAQGNMNVVGETFEPELILPLNDHKRTMELIAANIPMARRFANGGMVGGGNVSAAFGGVTLHYAPVINGSGLSEAALQRVLRKERKDTLEQVEAKLYRDRKR